MKTHLTTKNSYFVTVPIIAENRRGNLVFCEAKKQIPFDIKRLYWIYNVNSKLTRGAHAHKKTEQVLFCLSGSVEIELDDGVHKDSVVLNTPYIGIYLGKKLWHEMKNFQKDTILLVVASEYYNEKDYIRDYSVFTKYITKQ